jgi:hypothetical protein
LFVADDFRLTSEVFCASLGCVSDYPLDDGYIAFGLVIDELSPVDFLESLARV